MHSSPTRTRTDLVCTYDLGHSGISVIKVRGWFSSTNVTKREQASTRYHKMRLSVASQRFGEADKIYYSDFAEFRTVVKARFDCIDTRLGAS